MSSLTDLTLQETLRGLERKEFSALEVSQAYNAAIERASELNAFITPTPELAEGQARESDRRRGEKSALALEGIPIAIKDIFCTQGVLTTAGSLILRNFIPPYESTVTEKLWDSGAVLLGKTNLDEFAMGSSNDWSAYGAVVSPWSEFGGKKLVPGGSSGGSAAAVSSRCAAAALATDTGGSVRLPASFCGIVGLKPTYGRCSRWGMIAFASSLDQASVMTRSVYDAGLILSVIGAFDPKDSTCVDHPSLDYTKMIEQGVRGLRVGIPEEYNLSELSGSIVRLWAQGQEWLREAGAEIVPISLPHTEYALPTYYIISSAEASSNLARYDGVRYGERYEADSLISTYEKTRRLYLGPEVKRRVLIGTYVLSAGYYEDYYLKAQKVRTRIATDFKEAFQKCEAILTPTVPFTAFEIGEKITDPVTMYLNDILTVPASLAGLPAISVPAGLENGLPLGLQLIGRVFDEPTLLRIARTLEKQANFTAKPPWMAAANGQDA